MRLWSPAGPRTTPAHASYPPPYRTSPPRIPSPAKHSAAIPTVHSRTHRKPAALAALTARTITYRRTLQGNPSCEILLGHFSEIRSGLSVRKIPDCRSQIESSGSQPSRKFRFSGFGHRPSWYVRTAALGSRLGRLPKAEATGLAPKQSADALL